MRVRVAARRGLRRPGTTVLVEGPLTFGLYFFMLMSVFEFCRYVFVVQMAIQSAREGARLAACNIINTGAEWTGTSGTNDVNYGGTRPYFTVPAVTTRVTSKMTGAETSVVPRDNGGGTMPRVQIFPLDSTTSGLYADPPVIRPRLQPDPTASPPIVTAAWNNARFPERLGVRVTGTYTPIMPVMAPASGRASRVFGPITIDVVVIVTSEG